MATMTTHEDRAPAARSSSGQLPGGEEMPRSQRELLERLQKRFSEAKVARAQYEPDWFLNLAYFVGDQWIFWNRGHLERPRFDKRDPVTDNRIKGIVMTRIARKTKSLPTWVATPTSLDESDVEAAKLTDQVLESDWLEMRLTRRMFGALEWAELCGAGLWKMYYDPQRGGKASYMLHEDGAAYMHNDAPLRADDVGEDMELPEDVAPREIAEGDVCVEVISPFEFFPDPLATSMEDLEFCFECKVRSTDYVEMRYGKKVGEDTDAPLGIAESRLAGSSVLPGLSGVSSREGRRRGVKVYEYWSRPSPEYPNGLRVCWAGDTILAIDEQPFSYAQAGKPADPIPYVMFQGVHVPGRFWPSTVTTDLRGPQTLLNRTKTQIYENVARVGNPILLWSRYAGKRTYRGLPGEVIEYDDSTPNAQPKWMDPPNLPAYVREVEDRYLDAMQEIAGLHEVSKATVPTGVTAASAINLLQEADDTRMGPEVGSVEETLGEAGQKLINLRAAYTDVERVLRIAGEDGDWDIREWKGVTLGDGVQVSVQAGSMMPRSRAAKQAAMTEILGLVIQYQLPIPPRNLRRFMRDYEVGAIDRLFADVAPVEAQITWENRQLAQAIGDGQGGPLPINPYDDDDLHMAGHEEFFISGRFRRLPEQAKQAAIQHNELHRQRRMKMRELQVQEMAKSAVVGQQTEVEGDVTREWEKAAAGAAADVARNEAIPQQQNGSTSGGA